MAKGLCHLHGVNIIHGDIKSGNILLDNYFKPYIGDFGLARGGAESKDKSHKTISQIIGTEPYLPDDYKRNHELHFGVDTFCFGIFLFELATGKSPSFQKGKYTMRDIMTMPSTKTINDYVDPNVGMDKWAAVFFELGKECAHKIRSRRPDMNSVKLAIERLIRNIPESMVLQQYHDERNLPVNSGGQGEEEGIPGVPDVIKNPPSESNESTKVHSSETRSGDSYDTSAENEETNDYSESEEPFDNPDLSHV